MNNPPDQRTVRMRLNALGTCVGIAFQLGPPDHLASVQAPGHETAYVVLDDTLASLSGSITMSRDHTIDVVADTIYTAASMSPAATGIARIITNLLNNADKQTPYRQLMERWVYGLGPLNTNPDTLAHDDALAWHMTVDAVRDSAKLSAVDRALNGVTFRVWNLHQTFPFITSDYLGVSMSESATGRFGLRESAVSNLVPQSLRDLPQEKTHFVYVNGMLTDPGRPGDTQGSAYSTLGKLYPIVRGMPRFPATTTTIEHVYSARGSVQMEEFNILNPCLMDAKVRASFFSRVPLLSTISGAISYAKCRDIRFTKSIITADIVQAAIARERIIRNVPPTTEDVSLVARHVTKHRTVMDEHTIMVGHSRGNLVIAGAMRLLPTPEYEDHPIQVDEACVGTIALASPAPRANYPVEDPYKLGYTIEGDIIQATVTNGWEELGTIATVNAMNTLNPLEQLSLRSRLHSVDQTYLQDATSLARFRALATQLHRECLEGELVAEPRVVTARAGSRFDVKLTLKNQNGRELYGHKINGGTSSALDLVEPHLRWDAPFRYIAMTPDEEPADIGYKTRTATEDVSVTIPLSTIEGVTLVERDSSWWTIWAANNGGLGDPPPAIYPTQKWDGSDPCPTTLVRTISAYGPNGQPAYVDWKLNCARFYTAGAGNVVDPLVAAQVKRFQYAFRSPEGVVGGYGGGSARCGGGKRCVESVKVRAISFGERVIAYSGFVGVSSVIVVNRSPTPVTPEEQPETPPRPMPKPIGPTARPRPYPSSSPDTAKVNTYEN